MTLFFEIIVSEAGVLGSADDVILQFGIKKIELLTEARYSDRKIVVFIGMSLGINERIGINGVELYVGKSQLAGGDEHIRQSIDIVIGEQLRVHLHYR